MQAVDIIHKQIVQMAVLIVEYIKHGIEVKKESKVEKQQRLKFLLSQASLLVHWIVQFDPQNVNAKDLYLPPDLQDLYNYSEKIIRKLPDFLRETILHRLNKISQKGLYATTRMDSLGKSSENFHFDIQSPRQTKITSSHNSDSPKTNFP